MATNTTNLGLIKPDVLDFYDVGVSNNNMDILDSTIGAVVDMKTAGGTGNAITVSLPGITEYVGNRKFTFLATANNSGTATTVQVNTLGAKPLYKANTTTPPNIVSGKAYEVWYSAGSDCFFLKASAEGNAVASEVLAGKTFSNDDDSGILGTMPNNGSDSAVLPINGSHTIPAGYHDGTGKVTQSIPTQGAQTYTPGTSNQTIPAGRYLSGTQTIIGDADLTAGNIRYGANIFGVGGTFSYTTSGASASQILSGRVAYVNGSAVTGTIPSKGAQTFTPGTTNQTISSGQYLSGTQTIAGDADLVAGNIKSGVNIFGVVGTLSPLPTVTTGSNLIFRPSTALDYNTSEKTYLNATVNVGGVYRIDAYPIRPYEACGYIRVYINNVLVVSLSNCWSETPSLKTATFTAPLGANIQVRTYSTVSTGGGNINSNYFALYANWGQLQHI